MKRSILVLALGLIVGCQPGAGGGGGGGGTIEGDIDLIDENAPADQQLGRFDVQAGVPATRTGTITFESSAGDLPSGSVGLSPESIQLSGAGGKASVALQGGTLVVTVWVAAIDLLETVCEVGEQYGPYSVTLDENNVPTAIDPSTIVLTDATLDLLAVGEFSICIVVVSPIDGTVTIDRLELNLNL